MPFVETDIVSADIVFVCMRTENSKSFHLSLHFTYCSKAIRAFALLFVAAVSIKVQMQKHKNKQTNKNPKIFT